MTGATSTGRPPAEGPVRTCIGCGAKASQRELARVRVLADEVVGDPRAVAGRGAWLHRAEPCLERAVKRRAFARALHAPSARVDPRALREWLTGNTRKD